MFLYLQGKVTERRNSSSDTVAKSPPSKVIEQSPMSIIESHLNGSHLAFDAV